MTNKVFGFIVVNKPIGMTSRKAIDAVKKIVRPTKLGHTGTLDPLAAGVLVVGLGPATRLTKYVQDLPKTYTAEFQFGVQSDSDDTETELHAVASAKRFEIDDLQEKIASFIGEISQTPPVYSAVKINGERAYDLARKGKSVEIKPKLVNVYAIEILSFAYPNCCLRIVCGSGTYIRSIGRDLGHCLESGAVMTSLIRNSVGHFNLKRSLSIESLEAQQIQDQLISPSEVFQNEQQVSLDDQQCKRLLDGKMFTEGELDVSSNCPSLIAVNQANQLLAVMTRHRSGLFKPELNFAHYFATH